VASITNGVHAATWTAPPFRALFDRSIPDWSLQNDNLRYAVCLPLHEIEAAHRQCKAALIEEVERRTGARLAEEVLTLGFARRATPYKRAGLLLSDLDHLRAIARKGPLQIVYAGKAHPRDEAGKEIIRSIIAAAGQLGAELPVVYLEDYDMRLGALMTAGVDVWVNTPHKPHEASGTSGMKAALNGVPSLSVLDGWWIEGHVEGVTGWSVGNGWNGEAEIDLERASLHRKLEHIVELFYGHPEKFRRIMRHCISLNGSFFNAERMLQQYAQSAYRLRSRAG
jgi:starch phosphorylase